MISFVAVSRTGSFPVEELKTILNSVIDTHALSIQYGQPGLPPLREGICTLMKNVYDITSSMDSILLQAVHSRRFTSARCL
jgi:DNA-binding transcriptional MocR family regulator